MGEIFGFRVRVSWGHFWAEELGLRILPLTKNPQNLRVRLKKPGGAARAA